MATYQATVTIQSGQTFLNDSSIGVLVGPPYQVTQTPATANSATEFLELLFTYYTAIYLFPPPTGTWTVTNVGDVYTITWVLPSVIDWGDISVTNAFVLYADTQGLGQFYTYGYFDLVESTETIVCPTCQELTKSACSDEYTFVAGLTPSTVYYVVIETNRNKRYVQAVTTDGSGDFAIDASATGFPIGFFIPEQLKYTIKVYSDSTLMLQQDITVGSTIYKCITLGFVNTVTTTASINFGVDFLIDDELNFIVDDLGNTFSV
jgi:hypothetical protein